MDKDELLARCWHWIVDSRGGGHSFGCRGSEMLPVESREPCNCGRDALLRDLEEATTARPFEATNGGPGDHP